MARIFFLIEIFIFICSNIFAQSAPGRITGRVVTTDGKAIPDVLIKVIGFNENILTDGVGQFVTKNFAPGKYDVKLIHIGFEQKIIGDIRITQESSCDIGTIVLTTRIMPFGEILVSATRTESHSFQVPAPLNIIPSSRLRERTVKTSAEALREETGIFVQKTNHGGGSAMIRGLGSNQILILVDGIRLNNSTYRLGNHQYLTTIDPNMLSQMEVIRGPNSVLYGSDALGGTINLITKKPLFSQDGTKWDYRLVNRYSTADNEKTCHGDMSIRGKRLDLSLGMSFKDYGDLKRGKNSSHKELEKSKSGFVQSPSGFSAYDADIKLVFNPALQQYWTLAYQLSRQSKVPRYDKYELDDYYRWFYHPQKRDLLYLNYESRWKIKLLENMKVSLSWQRQGEGREQQMRFDTDLTKENDIVNTAGVSVQFNPAFIRHSLSYGIDFYKDDVASSAVRIAPFTKTVTLEPRGRYPDGSDYLTFGAFCQDQWKVHPRLKTIAGARFSCFNTKFQGDAGPVHQQFNSLTASTGVVYSITSYLNLTGNIGQAFRAPNLSDITKLGESKGNVYEVPNYDLQPEKMLDFDIGFKVNSDNLNLTFSAYNAKIYDLLASQNARYQGLPTIQINGKEYIVKSKKNVGRALLRGVEASFDYRFLNDWHILGNISSTFGHNTTLDEPVGGIPPTFGLLEFKWEGSEYFITAYTRFADRQSRLSADDLDDPRIPKGGTPGWQIFGLRAGAKVSDWCALQAAVENIFDVNYREHGSGINGPGRNIIVSVEIGKDSSSGI